MLFRSAQSNYLYANLNNTEYVFNNAGAGGSTNYDLLSNGFKIRTTETWENGSGGSIVYAAFAESPFALNNRAR